MSSFDTSGYCVWFCPHPYTVQEKYRYADSLLKGGHPGSGAGGLALQGEAMEWGRFIWEKGWLWRHPAAALALSGGDGGEAAGLCPAVHGRRVGGTSQAEAYRRVRHEGLRLEMKRSLFPTRTARLWSRGPGRLGLCGLGVSHPDSVKPWVM